MLASASRMRWSQQRGPLPIVSQSRPLRPPRPIGYPRHRGLHVTKQARRTPTRARTLGLLAWLFSDSTGNVPYRRTMRTRLRRSQDGPRLAPYRVAGLRVSALLLRCPEKDPRRLLQRSPGGCISGLLAGTWKTPTCRDEPLSREPIFDRAACVLTGALTVTLATDWLRAPWRNALPPSTRF